MKKITLFHMGTRHLLFPILMAMYLLISPQSVFSALYDATIYDAVNYIFVDGVNGTDISCNRDCLPEYYRTWGTAAESISAAIDEAISTNAPGRDTIVVRGNSTYVDFVPEDDVNVTGAEWIADPDQYQTCDDNPTYVATVDGSAVDFNNAMPLGGIIQCLHITSSAVGVYMTGDGTATGIDNKTIFRKNYVTNTAGGKPCIKWDSGSAIIDDNEFTGCGRPGIVFLGEGGNSSMAAIISNNDFHGNSSNLQKYTEIYFETGGPVWVLVLDNLIDGDVRSGITFEGGENNVHITGNQIYSNPFAAIHVNAVQTGTITISGEQIFTFAGSSYTNGSPNIIRDNGRGGINIIHNVANMEIISNDIFDNQWGGISTDYIDPGSGYPNYDGFLGDMGGAVLTIKKNYIHGNGKALNTIGGGINVRQATATINNNVIYKNNRAGIRVGDYVTEILNNTVVSNGEGGYGGGIVYDNMANAALDAMPNGTLSSPIEVKNNIIAYNKSAALRGLGFTNTTPEERDYNLLYANNGFLATPDCSGEPPFCYIAQYGRFWGHVQDPNDIFADPLFVNMTTGSEDYQLDTGSAGLVAGEGLTEIGAWGGSDPMNWSHGLPHLALP